MQEAVNAHLIMTDSFYILAARLGLRASRTAPRLEGERIGIVQLYRHDPVGARLPGNPHPGGKTAAPEKTSSGRPLISMLLPLKHRRWRSLRRRQDDPVTQGLPNHTCLPKLHRL